MKNNQKKISTTGLGFYFLLIILAVFLFLHFAEVEKIILLFKEIKPLWLILALIVQVLTYVFTANIYHNLLDLYDYKSLISHRDLFKASIITLFLNQAVPAAGLSGFGYLAHFFQKRKMSSNEGFSVVILETFTYYFIHLVLVLFSLLYLLVVLPQKVNGVIITIGLFGALLFTFLNIAVLFFGSKKVMFYISGKIGKHKWLNFLFKKIRLKFPDTELLTKKWESPLYIIKNKSHFLWRPIFWQLMVFLADTVTILLLFNGFNFHPTFFSILIGLVLTKIIAMISISPGALVFFEGAMVLFYTSFNVPLHLAIIVTLLFRALSFWLPMPFGLFLYRHLEGVSDK